MAIGRIRAGRRTGQDYRPVARIVSRTGFNESGRQRVLGEIDADDQVFAKAFGHLIA